MNTDTLTALAGLILSLAFSYLPGLKSRYGALDGTAKRLVMLVVLAATSLSLYALACSPYADLLGMTVRCGTSGAIELLRLFLTALIANQAAYSLTPRFSARANGEADPIQPLQLSGRAQ